MGDLKKWAGFDKSGVWHSWKGGELEGTFQSFSIEEGEYGEAPVYIFLDREGELVKFQSSSKALARQMDGIEPGKTVCISREGNGTGTKYHVEVIG